MTNDELTTAIQQYTENYESSFVANIPLFIRQTEQRVFNTVLFPALRKNVLGELVAQNKYLGAPDDFLAVSAFAVVDGDSQYHFLLPKDANFIREAYPSAGDTELPQYYAIFGPQTSNERELTFLLGPTPDDNYTVELHYYYYPQSITEAASGRSWLGDNFDTVLLYGSLVEAYIYMKGEVDVYTAYETKFKEALAMAVRLGNGMERGDRYRSGEPRVQVT